MVEHGWLLPFYLSQCKANYTQPCALCGLGQLSVDSWTTIRQRSKLRIPWHRRGCILQLFTSIWCWRDCMVFPCWQRSRHCPAVCTDWPRRWLAEVSRRLLRHRRDHFRRDDSAISVEELRLLAGAWIFPGICMDELSQRNFCCLPLCWNCCRVYILNSLGCNVITRDDLHFVTGYV